MDLRKFVTNNKRYLGFKKGQAMVEFAIALPVFLLLLLGIIEVGRMVFMYSLAVNSSRDAVRYASAYGKSDNGFTKYKYCNGIKSVAKSSGYILALQDANISISYDKGPSTTSLGVCDYTSNGEDPDINLDTGNRVTVTVSTTYTPLVSLLPIPSRAITVSSSRTIMGVFDLPNK